MISLGDARCSVEPVQLLPVPHQQLHHNFGHAGTPASAAASTAASQAVMHNLFDLSRRIGVLKAQSEQLRGKTRLPSRQAKKADPD